MNFRGFLEIRYLSRATLPLLVLTATLGVVLAYSCSQTDRDGNSRSRIRAAAPDRFAGDRECASCHEIAFNEWQGSHHDYAMKRAVPSTVRGDFGDAVFSHRGVQYRFFRRDSLYLVEAPGPEGESRTYRITYTFGWEPLQQYLVDFGKGKLQALNIAWNTEREKWFALNPEQEIRHGDWLHWTGGAMNWNTMCADCHSTNLRKNYIAEADSFHTTWSSINVSCEACHGPGREHVQFMRSEEASEAAIERIRKDLRLTGTSGQREQIGQCAQCHSLREELTGAWSHTGNYLDHYNPTLPHPDAYFADGQIREEVYVYGSFLQSQMYRNDVRCDDCHEPHSLDLKANVTDNTLCLQCHVPSYNTREHHFHEPNTEAAQCVSCHMPGRYYMEVDFRRDHSFRVPRPDLTAAFGTPNTCNGCHEDKSADWAAGAVERWYGPERLDRYSEVLARADSLGAEALPELRELLADTARPAIARATAAWYLGQMTPGEEAAGLLEQALADDNALVRKSAAHALSNWPASGEEKRVALQEALDDSVRAVRVAAAGGLAEYTVSEVAFHLRKPFREALDEYRQYLDANRYFPGSQMNRGQFYEKRGEIERAIEAYRTALEKDSRFNPARINLAYLYNRRGENDRAENLLREVIGQEPGYGPAYYSLALLLAEEERLEEALSYFEQAAQRMPGNARVRYNQAISLQRLARPERAEQSYLEAVRLDPDNPDYRYGICTLYLQQNEPGKALPHAERLAELLPENRQAQDFLRQVRSRAGSR
ncbi:MAG: tetratricopeptide repeat protein [Balneolaceae bacterium]|nr:tetratricopeptide repeat protein [Balneolaceae bacterium]